MSSNLSIIRKVKCFKKYLRFSQIQAVRCLVSECGTKQSKGLVVGVYSKESETDNPKLTPAGEKFDEKTNGKLMELVKDANISGKLGKGKVFSNVDSEYRSVAVVGVGREGAGFNELEMLDEGMENVRVAAGVGARALQKQGATDICVDAMEYAEQAAEGAALAVYRYQDNKRKQDKEHIPKLDLFHSPDIDAWTRGLFKAEAQNLARRLTDTPANQMTPTAFAQAAVDALCPCGVDVEIRTMDWIEQNSLNSFLIVARGSCEPPVLLEISYCGTSPEDKPVLLIGKGMTFNSGGICLKEKGRMEEFRGAMSGAAVVVAAIRAAAALSLPINISTVIPLCENMPSGMAAKPGDVVTCLNGKTVAIETTNNNGVIMILDPLLYGVNTFRPRLVINVATMTHGARCAFGGGATAIFSSSHYIWKEMQKAGSLTGDRVWRLPLWKHYKKLVTDYVSFDISNLGHGSASACKAAAIIQEFLPCVDWAHLDTRGVGMLSTYGTIPYLTKHQMTGRPTRTLVQFLYQMACSESKDSEQSKRDAGGGLCLKSRENMSEFRGSMSGAAIVVSTIRAAAALSLPINVTAIVPLCENMPSGMAVKPGDVVTACNGLSISIQDPDQAGVVMLIDPMIYAQNLFKPKTVIDIATTAEGVRTGLGDSAAGVFTNSKRLWDKLEKSGSLTGDRVWRMPLWKYFEEQVTDYISFDISNVGHGTASSCNAAAVLYKFIPCRDWAHLDIHGVGMLAKYGTPSYLLTNKMSGRPTRTLIQLLYELSTEESPPRCK